MWLGNVHDDQGDKVDTGCLICEFGYELWAVLWIVVSKLEPHGREGNAVALNPPETHCEGEEAL